MRRVSSGSPEPLGLTLSGAGANIAVFSAHATRIELCLFDAHGVTEIERIVLPERTGEIFHAHVDGITAGARYGLRAHGPYAPHDGHRFNPAKLLVDPHARALDRPFSLHPGLCGQRPNGWRDDIDSAPFVPKSIAVHDPIPAAASPRAERTPVPWSEMVVYELHVRGFTKQHPGVPSAVRGTCAGLAHPAAIEHLTRLGITTVELMPIAAAIDESHLVRAGLTNYWGYNTVGWMVPDPRLAPGGITELRECVATLHDAGIEVLLDVVLNHSGEGEANGPTLSLRGLDNATYYRLPREQKDRYVNDTGCGNTLALDRPPVLRLALDTLRHYARAAGVDGFRYDLATTLARGDDGFDPAAPFLTALAQDPVLRDLKHIAEPWDVGYGGYRVGEFPAAWGEWNDRYRDTVRRFWRGDGEHVGELATRVAGSPDIFGTRSRPPSRSINFVAAHDGFTLTDLVSYERKHNEANGEQNRDGTSANNSWNHGVEGPTTDPGVASARQRDVRALLATLFFSRGTPMLSMGDELGRTQLGNNNAYAQDGALAWIDWSHADTHLAAFVASLVRLRRAHPALRADRWLTGRTSGAASGAEGASAASSAALPDVEWRRPDGHLMTFTDWSSGTVRTLVAVLHHPAEGETPADRVLVAFHGGGDCLLHPPEPNNGAAWHQLIDTAASTPVLVPSVPVRSGGLRVSPRSVVLLAERRVELLLDGVAELHAVQHHLLGQ